MSRTHASAMLIVMFLFATLTVAMTADGPVPQVVAEYISIETEPNDCFPDSTWWGLSPDEPYTFAGKINPIGDVDYLVHFNNDFAQNLIVDWQPPSGSPLKGVLSLYDDSGHLLAANACSRPGTCLQYTFSTPNHYYYLKVSSADRAGGLAYEYQFTMQMIDVIDANEPNDTSADATPITYIQPYDSFSGLLAGCDDVDMFKFESKSGDLIQIYIWTNWELLDADGQLIAALNDGPYVSIPEDGTYYLRVFGEWACDQRYEFGIYLLEHEPNNSALEAMPLLLSEIDTTQGRGLNVPCRDVDFYAFQGRAGDEVKSERSRDRDLQLLDSDLNVLGELKAPKLGTILATLPADGTYYLRVSTPPDRCDEKNAYSVSLHLVDRPLYLSFNKAGEVQGISFTSGDVLRYWLHTGRWEMYMDLSDVGLNGNLTSLLLDDYTLLGFADSYKLPVIGAIPPQDLMLFGPLHDSDYNFSLGSETIGCIAPGLDGSDVGLTTSAERIDSVGTNFNTGEYDWYYSSIILSTEGRANVPMMSGGLRLEDEDLGRFISTGIGADIQGAWEPYFDGSMYGLAAADVIGSDAERVTNDRNGSYVDSLWLSFDRQVTLGGLTFAPGDIAQCSDSRFDHRYPCATVDKIFDISDAGLAGYKVDALEIGPKE